MRAAGIVSDHAANCAAVVRGRVGRECKAVHVGAVSRSIEDNSRLNAREAALRIELENLIHILCEVEHDGDVTGLPGEAGTCAARQNGCTKLATGGECGADIVRVFGKHQADGNLAIVGGIRGVQSAAASVKAHFALQIPLQLALKFGGSRERVYRLAVRTKRKRLNGAVLVSIRHLSYRLPDRGNLWGRLQCETLLRLHPESQNRPEQK